MSHHINVGRRFSGGIFNGLFGNPVREQAVSEQYRTYLRGVFKSHPGQTRWLKAQMEQGASLHCPGCKEGSPTCHARIIEEEIARL